MTREECLAYRQRCPYDAMGDFSVFSEKKEDSRDKQYRVRLNDAEDEMLSFCSEETGEAKSEIFRKALKA